MLSQLVFITLALAVLVQAMDFQFSYRYLRGVHDISKEARLKFVRSLESFKESADMNLICRHKKDMTTQYSEFASEIFKVSAEEKLELRAAAHEAMEKYLDEECPAEWRKYLWIIVLGGIALISGAFFLFFFWKRRKAKQPQQQTNVEMNPQATSQV